ncbi:MAG: sulfotransferase, partial [Fulvivirga sp.]
MFKAIQFIGTQRSGSNLLRLILNQHDLISAPHPPHLLQTFVPLMPYYHAAFGNDLSVLVDNMCQWVEFNPVPWTGVILDRRKILDPSTSIYDIYEQIYIEKAKIDNAKIWCCKSTFNVHYVDQLEIKIKPFYIHLYRDGRDVAASFKKIMVGPKHVYHVAQQWKNEQMISLRFLQDIPEDRKIHISYESLLDQPDEIVGSICSKLEIDYTSDMLNYYTSEESKHTASSGKMWEAVIKPIVKNNKGKFYDELTEEE